MIIDTHVHVVAADQQKYPRRLASVNTEWVTDTSAETLLALMRAAGIDRTILVQAYSAYEYDNNYAADCARQYPDRFIGVCILDPRQPTAPDQLTYWVKERGMQGLRLFNLTRPAGAALDDPQTFQVWERAAALQVPLCVCTSFRQIPALATGLERFPEVRVALDHVGLPRLEDGPPYDNLEPLLALARFSNLYLKFSTVTLYAAHDGQSTPRAFFRRLLDSFGAERIMWGSNYPATYDRSLQQQLELARVELDWLSPDETRWLFGATARSLWPALG